ncbi:MAG TPA: hypothetical protein DCS93_30700 [Microscillaceae bacterium]|nr:hypothetical protein [Microscillaceae bacterium]
MVGLCALSFFSEVKGQSTTGAFYEILSNGNMSLKANVDNKSDDLRIKFFVKGTELASFMNNQSGYKSLDLFNGTGLRIVQGGNIWVGDQGYIYLEKGNLTLGEGKVGIGTLSPDEKLTVNGKIHAKGLTLDLNFPAPDYVFAEEYKLRSLQEVEAYINQYHHLPAVPSAKTMEKEGVKMLEMSMKLLEKVEELTLYTIAQQKEITKLKAQVKQLQQKK